MHYLWNFWREITEELCLIIVFGPKKFGDGEGGRHECWIMTPFHFHWCPFVMEYALLLTNCTPCPQQLPASLNGLSMVFTEMGNLHINIITNNCKSSVLSFKNPLMESCGYLLALVIIFY